jgi:hypothetical protein
VLRDRRTCAGGARSVARTESVLVSQARSLGGSIAGRVIAWRISRHQLRTPSCSRMSARVLPMRRERAGAWRRPASNSASGRSRRSARERVMRRTARLKTLAHRADPLGRATQPTHSPPQDNAHLRSSDLAATAQPALDARELDSQRTSSGSGRSRVLHRCERRRTKQTDDES